MKYSSVFVFFEREGILHDMKFSTRVHTIFLPCFLSLVLVFAVTHAATTISTDIETSGSLLLNGTTSGTVTVKPATTAGTWTLILPTDDGTNGQVLTTDGNGTTSWSTVSGGGGSVLLPENEIAFGTGSGITSSSRLTFNPSTGELFLSSPGGELSSIFTAGGVMSSYDDNVEAFYFADNTLTAKSGKLGVNTDPTVALDVVGDVIIKDNTSYPDGLLNVSPSSGIVLIGDNAGDLNNTNVAINDGNGEIDYVADNHFFTGNINFNNYGQGNITGTPTTYAAFDTSGNVIETPAPKIYRALISQSGTGDPVATVLENTLGFNVTWVRQSTGYYQALGFPDTGSEMALCSLIGMSNDPTNINCGASDIGEIWTFKPGDTNTSYDNWYAQIEILIYGSGNR